MTARPSFRTDARRLGLGLLVGAVVLGGAIFLQRAAMALSPTWAAGLRWAFWTWLLGVLALGVRADRRRRSLGHPPGDAPEPTIPLGPLFRALALLLGALSLVCGFVLPTLFAFVLLGERRWPDATEWAVLALSLGMLYYGWHFVQSAVRGHSTFPDPATWGVGHRGA